MKKYETYAFSGIGYKKLFSYQDWRIAMLNYIKELEIDHIDYVEAHQKTDEAFILLEGSCTLFFAQIENEKVIGFDAVRMQSNQVYKIYANVFHTHTLSKDAKLLIIEEENTADENSPKIVLDQVAKLKLKASYEELNHDL